VGLKINSIQIEQNFDFGNVSLGGKDNTISGNSTYSTILAGQNNTIGTHSYNSVILGGSGLELDNENNVVLVPQLKIATASNVSASASRFLVWDDNNYVGYRDVSTIGGSGSVAIPVDEVAFGTGTGLTSSIKFKFDPIYNNLIASDGSSIQSSIHSVIVGGYNNEINGSGTSRYSSILGGYSNYIGQIAGAPSYAFIVGGGQNEIRNGSINAGIVGGLTNSINCGSRSFIAGGYGNNIYRQSYD